MYVISIYMFILIIIYLENKLYFKSLNVYECVH